MSVTLNDLLENVRKYDPSSIYEITKAYKYAERLHNGQFRQSGEPYIIHPLSVAIILSEQHLDKDTICAGLLHDVIEDNEDISIEDISRDFNEDVAILVDGVTKIGRLEFNSKHEQNMANTRKIITGFVKDVRIIFIKLADRLHNMRTLQYKSKEKQRENSFETLDIFAPFAYYLGAYRIKSELEDLSLKYIYPDEYQKLEEYKLKLEEESKNCLQEMLGVINEILINQNIPHDIKVRTKNIYGIYKRLEKGHKISNIHDLLSLKIMVDNISNCYQTLGLVHSKYHQINDKFKDYIYNPKTNMYQSLHTTVFAPFNYLVQTQIRTFEMDLVASFGLATYWLKNGENTRLEMQEEFKNKYQLFKSLLEIDEMFSDNQEFVIQAKQELFSDQIYVFTPKGEIIALPKGSTVIDFAYQIHTKIGDHMMGAYVNNNFERPNYVLHNKDRVCILTDDLIIGPNKEWLQCVKTARARKKIKEKIAI